MPTCSSLSAHEVGIASLQVACNGFVISNSVMFEYKTSPSEAETAQSEERYSGGSNADRHRSWSAENDYENDNLLRFTLMQRLEAVDAQLQIKQEPDTGSDQVCFFLKLSHSVYMKKLIFYKKNVDEAKK